MILRLALISVLVAASSANASDELVDRSRGMPLPMKRPRVRLGVWGALGLGPGPSNYSSPWEAVELAPFVEFDLGWLGLRLAAPFKGGALGFVNVLPLFAGGMSAELRVNFTERFSAGIGAEVALNTFLNESEPSGPYLTMGPTVTLGCFRFGEGLHHELSLSGSMLVEPWSGWVAGGFAFVRYAYLFF